MSMRERLAFATMVAISFLYQAARHGAFVHCAAALASMALCVGLVAMIARTLRNNAPAIVAALTMKGR